MTAIITKKSTKKFANNLTNGIVWNIQKPSKPVIGDAYWDLNSGDGFLWDGYSWLEFTEKGESKTKLLIPTEEQLEEHPSLKRAWEEYLVIKRLLGV